MSRSEAASEFKRREDAARRSRRLAKGLCTAAGGPSGFLAGFALYRLGLPVGACLVSGLLLVLASMVLPFVLPDVNPRRWRASLSEEAAERYRLMEFDDIGSEVAAVERLTGKHVKHWPTDYWFDAPGVFWEDAVEAARSEAGAAWGCIILLLLLDLGFIAVLFS